MAGSISAHGSCPAKPHKMPDPRHPPFPIGPHSPSAEQLLSSWAKKRPESLLRSYFAAFSNDRSWDRSSCSMKLVFTNSTLIGGTEVGPRALASDAADAGGTEVVTT